MNKEKSRLFAHVRIQQKGVNYWETYEHVVNYISLISL